ncbi:MFS transporter [Novosphingobium sp. AAP83]|uniref:MFS transporter n=1 Tax=Novosphingobium sp. AAP83 TaxID=1523425 RepID=UPI0006B896DA|nr:MFS transporter [Novosphingobium sp. AAP83]KPF87945.1 MFS transporter [Novosphingobium sp. AAP83]
MTDESLTHTMAGTRHGIVVMICSVMPVMAIIALVPILPLLLEEFAMTPGHQFLVPITLTVPALCVALFSPLAGWLADRMGRKALLIGALVAYAALGIIPMFLRDLGQILASRIALGLVEAVIMTVSTVLIGDYFEGARREKWISVQIGSASISAIILIAVSGALAEVLGSRGPFLLYLLAIPAALAASIILYEPKVTKPLSEAEGGRFPFAVVLPLALTTVFVGVSFYTVIVQLGPILQMSDDVPPIAIGLIGAVCNIAVTIGAVAFHKSGREAGAGLLGLGLAISAIGYAGAGLSGSLPLIAASLIFASVGSGIMLPNMLTWTMRSLPPESRGRGLGLWTGAFFLGQFLAPIVATAVTGATGGLATALIVFAGALALAAGSTLLVTRAAPA